MGLEEFAKYDAEFSLRGGRDATEGFLTETLVKHHKGGWHLAYNTEAEVPDPDLRALRKRLATGGIIWSPGQRQLLADTPGPADLRAAATRALVACCGECRDLLREQLKAAENCG